MSKKRTQNAAAKNPDARAWAEIDLKSLSHNLSVLRGLLPESCTLMAVVKADAYGHGAVRVSKELYKLGVRFFCVATIDEGIELRKGGVKGDVLVLGYTPPSRFGQLRRYSLTQTVVDFGHALLLREYKKPVRVHIKIDTGMYRFGEPSENIDRIIEIFKMENLRIGGIFTHLCFSDSAAPEAVSATRMQVKRFDNLLEQLKTRGITLPKTHVQSSYGALNYPELNYDYARVGLALYGAIDNAMLFREEPLELRPVLSIKARVALVRDLRAGAAAGYGLDFVAARDMKIAMVSIGYADGIPRGISGKAAWAGVNGRMAPIIGRVCMDSLMIDVTEIEGLSRDDAVTVMGGASSQALSAVQMSGLCDAIPNEFLSRLGKRPERVYSDI